jgi:hypothetical protein
MRCSNSAIQSRRRKRPAVEVLEERQLLAVITVDTAADETAMDSTLSLREAIEVSDGTLAISLLSAQERAQVSGAVGNSNTIDFNIPKSDQGYDSASGVWTITLHSELPAITTNAAVIDGYTQPGASPNTLAQGDNAKLAIAINGASAGAISGLTIGQSGSEAMGLDIENCALNGVLFAAGGHSQVAGCFIGSNPSGEAAAANGVGVMVESSSNIIGGPDLGDRNIISGNGNSTNPGDGVHIPDQGKNPLNIEPTGNQIENNYIGVDANGTMALGNSNAGVYDYGSGNTCGGTTAGLGNVISGNYVNVNTGGSVAIEGNYIGTNATGTAALKNPGFGISAVQDPSGPAVLSTIIMNNVVSGNGQDGVYVVGSSKESLATYTIANNLIGTNASGTAAIRNVVDGIYLNNVENTSVVNNVISANGEYGLLGNFSVVVIQGNLIGTDRTGQVSLGNTWAGIELVGATGSLVGGMGPGEGNVIANNGLQGIYVGGLQNRITRNSIFGNTAAGIQVQSNPPAPVLSFTPGAGSTGTLSGKLKAAANLAYTVEIFSNPSAAPAGVEQGKTFVEDLTVSTDGSGNGSFSLAEPSGYYTATATDPSGTTSPFSKSAGQQGLGATQTAVSSSANPATAGEQVTFTAVVTAPGYQGTPAGTVTFSIDGQPQPPVQLSLIGGLDEAVFATSTLSAGSHTVTASYSGDAHVGPSSGSLASQQVTAPGLKSTTTRLTSSPNPSTAGQAVTITAIVSPSGTAGKPTGSVTFTIDGISQPRALLRVVNGREEANLSVASLAKGTHTITAAYSGDSSFAPSAVTSALVQTVGAVTPPGADGPKVELVQRFGVHMQATSLVLTFDEALDPASAVSLKNYRLVDPNGSPVRISSAVLDAKTNSVTLRPAERINLHRKYHLTVIGTGPGGVKSAQGLLLDGTDAGTPDSNYNCSLTWRNVVLTPAELKKYIHPGQAKPAGALTHPFSHRHN